ncbi:hypothetical protein EV715DRAFT_267062 [Schizophyllum commune]
MTTAVPPVQATSARERLAQRLNAPPRTVSTIWDSERWWIDHQPWLESRGYMLRPRYRPGWEPSWHSEKDKGGREQAEDSVPMSYPFLMDATHPDDDKYQLMVLPLLRSYASPRFDTIGEAIECFRQIIQGLCFLHENRIAHRDIHRLNIMMDASPLYTIPYHPIEQTKRRDVKGLAAASYTRTQRPVKYYIIDFGLSVRYDTLDPPPVEIPVLGGDKTVPEFKGDDPSKRYGGLSKLYNPFPTDVYCLGNWIREDFLEGTRNERSNEVLTSKRLGFEFLRPLVESMTQADPSKRPTMDEVAERFESLAASLSSWKLRSRVAKENDNPLYNSPAGSGLVLQPADNSPRVAKGASRNYNGNSPALASYVRMLGSRWRLVSFLEPRARGIPLKLVPRLDVPLWLSDFSALSFPAAVP